MAKEVLVGVDIGGTKTAVLVADRALTVRGEAVASTSVDSPAALVAGVMDTVHRALARANAAPEDVAALSAGIPGQVDPQSGIVRMAVNLNLEAFGLRDALSDRMGIPVLLENDMRLAAVGAHAYYQDRTPVAHLAYLGIGTGISAGVVLNGELYRGAHGMAGEIGHTIVNPGGELCNCGQRGCLETIVSGPAIVRQATALLPRRNDGSTWTPGDIFQAARDVQPQARSVVDRVVSYLGRAIQWLVMTYDVEKIVLGGGVMGSSELFWDLLLAQLERMRDHSMLATAMLEPARIVLLPGAYNAGLWGAVHQAHRFVERQPAGSAALFSQSSAGAGPTELGGEPRIEH